MRIQGIVDFKRHFAYFVTVEQELPAGKLAILVQTDTESRSQLEQLKGLAVFEELTKC